MEHTLYINGKKFKESNPMTINPRVSKVVYKLINGKMTEVYAPELAKALREDMLNKLGLKE